MPNFATFLLERLGTFERAVLTAVDHLGPDAYCVSITDHLEGVLNRGISDGQTSRALSALSRSGLLKSERVLPDKPAKHQRSRIVYSFTPEGLRMIREARLTTANSNSEAGVSAPAFA